MTVTPDNGECSRHRRPSVSATIAEDNGAHVSSPFPSPFPSRSSSPSSSPLLLPSVSPSSWHVAAMARVPKPGNERAIAYLISRVTSQAQWPYDHACHSSSINYSSRLNFLPPVRKKRRVFVMRVPSSPRSAKLLLASPNRRKRKSRGAWPFVESVKGTGFKRRSSFVVTWIRQHGDYIEL